jgi:hypothetical protein
MPQGAPERAARLDAELERQAEAIVLPSARDVEAAVRVYLLSRNADAGTGNNVYRDLKVQRDHGPVKITYGPQIDKGPTDSHFRLESGARLSFCIILREGGGRCALVSYRFQLNLPDARSPSFYRFDLNKQAHETPLQEPRSHLHPGHDKIRLPFPPMAPLELLDRIFLVIEPVLVR